MKTFDKTESEKIYTVVEVSRGVAATAYNFKHFKNAQRCLSKLRKERNLDEDDVQIFENEIVD